MAGELMNTPLGGILHRTTGGLMANSESLPALDSFAPGHKFFVGIDSDGCVFDSMEIKHKECFCPEFINHYGLQPASRYAREVWEFVNLYSQTRGINRFKAVLLALGFARSRREIVEREVDVPVLDNLAEWVAGESRLGNPQLETAIAEARSPDGGPESERLAELERVYRWSLDVNAAVKRIVRNVPPFPGVRESLRRLDGTADVVVVSQTPTEALLREWQEHAIDSRVALIAGQELGTKSDHLVATAGVAGRYEADHVLMIGDAPGDLEAARSVGALFYPVLPGREEESWKRLTDESLDAFLSASYAGSYESALIDEFSQVLPADPPWQSVPEAG
jgi:phosphoglycolate phosphatase-like HAD superfamily hydrolase